jgi:flagellar motor switch protein FliN/FliY
MFASAADVLGTLVDRAVTATAAVASANETSIRIEPATVATLTTIPSAGFSFSTQYGKSALAHVVALMLGTPAGEGEMDAMQLSIVSETVAQISSAMAERLTQQLKVASENIVSEVPTEAGKFPAPPFSSFATTLDVAGEFKVELRLDFDGVALAKIDAKALEVAAAPPQPAAAAPPQPAAASAPQAAAEAVPQAPVQPSRPAAPASRPAAAPARPAAAAPKSQPVTYSPMAPTALHAAAPGQANLDLVRDIPLEISAVLGQTALSLRDVVALQRGSVLELDKLSSDPIDLYVNNILIARGEVVVVDEKFAVKISELNPVVDKV